MALSNNTILLIIIFLRVFLGNTDELTSTYSKVARWGPGRNSKNEGRSNGESFWTHR